MNDIQLNLGCCIEGLSELETGSIDAVITDPPYFCGMTHNGTKGTYNDLNMVKPFFAQVFSEFQRVLKPDGEIYIFCDWRTYPFFYPLLESILTVRNRITWDKISGAGCYYSFTHACLLL